MERDFILIHGVEKKEASVKIINNDFDFDDEKEDSEEDEDEEEDSLDLETVIR